MKERRTTTDGGEGKEMKLSQKTIIYGSEGKRRHMRKRQTQKKGGWHEKLLVSKITTRRGRDGDGGSP